jgi:hypothetical protein
MYGRPQSRKYSGAKSLSGLAKRYKVSWNQLHHSMDEYGDLYFQESI